MVSKPPAAPKGVEPPTDWTRAAQWYDDLVGDTGSEFHQRVVLPGVMRLISPKSTEKVLDVACGQGVLCRLLTSRGISVTGIDSAAPLIDAARKHGPKEISYRVADARDLARLPVGRFDAAALVLAIQNIHPLAPLLTGISAVLNPGGRLVVVMMHPAFRGPKCSAWGWDESTKVQFRRVDRYLIPRKEPIVTHPGDVTQEYLWSFHRPIEAYFKAIRNAGMMVDALEEWPSHKHSDSGPRAAAENRARQEIPMFLALRAVKVATAPAQSALDTDSPDTSAPLDTTSNLPSIHE